jgi:hypothetical protein
MPYEEVFGSMRLLADPEPETCEDCGHALNLHGEYGCEHEFGDDEFTGAARGQCGCEAYEEETDHVQE